MIRQLITVKGKRYALVPPGELERLERLAALSEESPAWPAADAQGNMPAVAFARVAIARTIIQKRRALNLRQEDLARLAGIRVETISRLESGKHAPTKGTVDKIDRALARAEQNKKPRRLLK